MTYVVTDNCKSCRFTDCVAVCPVDCFKADADMLYIDPEECIDCGACEPVCPVTAIFAEDDVPDAQQEYTPLNAQWFKEPDAVRARINELSPPA